VPGVGDKLVAVQVEFSAFDIEVEISGFIGQARELGVVIIPYSPLGRGSFSSLSHIHPLSDPLPNQG
jgi:aryl-alcohol dehydrogenase-like predicted oxidoreductase